MNAANLWPLKVFYDGACPVCTRAMMVYRRRDALAHIEWIDVTRPGFDAAAYGLDAGKLRRAMHAITPDRRIFTRTAAFVKIWEALPPTGGRRFLRALFAIPGMIAVANLFYRAFARNRYRLTGRCTPQSCNTQP